MRLISRHASTARPSGVRDRIRFSSARPYGPTDRKLQRIDLDPAGDPLDCSQGQVALATLKAARVVAVHLDEVSEGFLAEAARLAVAPEVLPQLPLQVAPTRRRSWGCYGQVYRLISSITDWQGATTGSADEARA